MLGLFLCLIMPTETVLVMLTILPTFFAAAAANTITVLNDGNRTDCSSNSSGTFCYSLSHTLNHMVIDDTTVFIASPEVCVSSFTTVNSVNNISIYGCGVGKTVICYHKGITFMNSRNIKLANLTIQLCSGEKSACNVKFNVESGQELYLNLLNCANVSIHQVKMSSLQGGLAIYHPTGHIDISHSMFERNNSSDGGVTVFTNHTNLTSIMFYACVFDANQNSFKGSNFRHSSGHGGGLQLQFEYAYNTQTRILDCQFTRNSAAWGGGLFVGYKLVAMNNFLHIMNTTFVSNEAKFYGGGGIDIGLYEIRNRINRNTILIENATFLNNSAEYGGGTTIFSDVDTHHLKNNLTFSDCRWENNSAQFSTAVDVSPIVYDNTVGYFLIIITFENCKFTGNKVFKGRRNNVTHSGTVMITALLVYFGGKTIFEGNLGSALCVVAANVVFKSRSDVTFDGNHGNSGGALALLGMATMQFSSHSMFLFQNNEAAFVGGAIYWHSIDQHDYFSTRTCFLKRRSLKKRSVNSNNVSFVFNNNTAYSEIGHSIYASTLRPCRYSCKNISVDQVGDIFNLTCIANFTFDNANRQANIATSVSNISLHSTNRLANGTLKATPGIVVQLNARAFDENHNDVTSIAVFQNSIIRENESMPTIIKLAPAYKHSSLSDVQLFGTPHSTGRLLVQANRVEGISTIINVEMVECPPGFVLSREACECSDSEYYGIRCTNSRAYIIFEGYWAGYMNTTMANPANLWTAPCALTFCNYTLNKLGDYEVNSFPLPELACASMLSEAICSANRTGRICGKCKQNFSVFFKSKEYTCHPETFLCDFGIILFVLSELVPLVIFFMTILFANISFTSGAVNGFILFAQMIDLLHIDSHKFLTARNTSFSLLVSIFQVIYGFFNLEFFSIERLSFCLWRGATVLDILVFKYITTVSAILLIVCLVLLMRYCSCWNRCKRCTRQRFNVSMIHGLSAFLVMAYSQSTRVTFDILQPTVLRSGNSTNLGVQYVVGLDGSIEYFSRQHAYYAIPALIFLVVIVILPPSILLINPLLIKVVALFQSRGFCKTSCSLYLLNKLLLVRLKPLFDHFQGCFKDNCRWVAGIYFLYRLVILFVRVASLNLSSFYIFTEFFLVVFVIFHSSVQPYQKRWHNILDTLIFGNLAVINGLSMFMYFWSSHIDLPMSKGFAQSVQLFLIYCPIFYIVTYTSVTWLRKYWSKRSSCFNERSLEIELPFRLLRSKSNSYSSF